VKHAIVLVDREQGGMEKLAEAGITAHPALKFSEILEHLLSSKKIDKEQYSLVKDYLSHG